MAETKTDDTKTDQAAEERLAQVWEKIKLLPAFRKAELIDYAEFLISREDDDDDVWEPDEEDEAALQAWLTGVNDHSVPLEEVIRESEELGDRVLD